MCLPTDLALTITEARQVAARTAAQYGAQYDKHLRAMIDDFIADAILDECLGDSRGDPALPHRAVAGGDRVGSSPDTKKI